jgi:hypothetical protein
MFTEARTQVPLVTMSFPSLRSAAPPYLTLGIKDLLKDDSRLLDEGRLFGCERLFNGGALMGLFEGRFAEGRITEGRIAEGKRIAEGELLKGNC